VSYRRVVLGIAVAVAAVAGGGAYVVEHHASSPSPVASPSVSTSPLPSVSPVPSRSPLALAVVPAEGPDAVAASIARALAGPLSDKALGARVDVYVAEDGNALYDRGGDVPVVPASTAKLFTAAAALRVLGPDRRFETRVVGTAPTNGTVSGDLTVVGGGDPTLTAEKSPTAYPRPATLADLANALRRAGVRRVTGGLVVDGSLFATPGLGPGWKPTYVTEGSVSPINAFMVDGGRIKPDDDDRSGSPDLTGGQRLVSALRAAGITVAKPVRRGRAPLTATTLASVQSPPVSALVQRLLQRSDNELAESLARHVALARSLPSDFGGASRAVEDAATEMGLDPPDLLDGCGLSPQDRVTPRELGGLLTFATREQSMGPLLDGLPVAAFTGTLATRYTKGTATRAAGRVRAKTGSLDNVATLAGIVETSGGRVLVFAFAADRLPTKYVSAAAKALDVAAAALVSA
jgi:D-alanyl-D-alanine carboxypeptidase/D-alanyl-D-alanine-endopeptidase (penicillin-binding protein 4)